MPLQLGLLGGQLTVAAAAQAYEEVDALCHQATQILGKVSQAGDGLKGPYVEAAALLDTQGQTDRALRCRTLADGMN
jgi:hypothetical protein